MSPSFYCFAKSDAIEGHSILFLNLSYFTQHDDPQLHPSVWTTRLSSSLRVTNTPLPMYTYSFISVNTRLTPQLSSGEYRRWTQPYRSLCSLLTWILSQITRNSIAGLYGSSIFWRTSILISIWSSLIYIPPQGTKAPSHVLTNTCGCFCGGHCSGGDEMESHCSFDLCLPGSQSSSLC